MVSLGTLCGRTFLISPSDTICPGTWGLFFHVLWLIFFATTLSNWPVEGCFHEEGDDSSFEIYLGNIFDICI